jgi:phosphoribosylaminoimidazolecarboxamide formyltransferase/IMP cyclohydrolase
MPQNIYFKEDLKFISNNEEILVQSEDIKKINIKDFKVVSKKKPNTKQMKNFYLLLMFVDMLNQMQLF